MLKNAFLSFIVFISLTTLYAKDVPSLSGPVIDEAKLLSWDFKTKVSRSLKKVKDKTGNQIQLYITNSLEGEPIEAFTIKAVDTWKLGTDGKDNGVLFLISISDRQMRIEVGRGLEGTLTDQRAGRIVDNATTFFKNGKFEEGILVALHQIAAEAGTGLDDLPVVKKKNYKNKKNLVFFIIFIIYILFFGRGGRGRGRYLRSSRYYGGSFGGSGSSGSSWSGGGGSFGGGGASGRW